MKMKKWAQREGFTLIELLIVVAIIAILAAIAVPNFLEAQVRAKVGRCKADMRSASVALESFYVDHNCYPPDASWKNWPTQYQSVTTKLSSSYFNRTVKPADVTADLYRFGNLFFLTTPIAYLTSLPRDPFAEKNKYEGALATWWWNNQVDWRVCMGFDTNFKRKTNGQVATVDGKEDADWLIISFGPDGNANTNKTTNGVGGDVMYYTSYDPTNGTVSYGDIYRCGP